MNLCFSLGTLSTSFVVINGTVGNMSPPPPRHHHHHHHHHHPNFSVATSQIIKLIRIGTDGEKEISWAVKTVSKYHEQCAEVTRDGRMFQNLAPATGQVRLQMVERLSDGAVSWLKQVDRTGVAIEMARQRHLVQYDDRSVADCPHCRRKVRLSQKTARQRRQSPNSAKVALFCDSVDRL